MAQPVFNAGQARRLAGYELSGLTLANVLPVELLQGSRVAYADITASPAYTCVFATE